jgi:hypothetical protein
MYIKVTDGVPAEYSLNKLRQDNPNVSFPRQPGDAILASYDVYHVVQGDRPTNDIVSLGPIVEVNGVWTQTYTGRDLTAEEKRQNMVVTMRQARFALLGINKLSLVDDAIALIPEPDHSKIKVEWEYASMVERTSPWMSTMGAALGLSDDELDRLFENASAL